MKILSLILILVTVSCGRPRSSDQEQSESKQRQRLETLSAEYVEVEGKYSGVMYFLADNTKYLVELNIRVVQDEDPTTGLALSPMLNGSLKVYDRLLNTESFIVSYGITGGSYDQKTGKISLEISDKLTIKGDANFNVMDAVLHSNIKGDVAELKLERIQ